MKDITETGCHQFWKKASSALFAKSNFPGGEMTKWYDELPPHDRRKIDQEPERYGHKKKNTRRWCKGKEGREHVTELRPSKWLTWHKIEGYNCGWSRWAKKRWQCTHTVVCVNCEKILEWRLPREKCPTWIARNKDTSNISK